MLTCLGLFTAACTSSTEPAPASTTTTERLTETVTIDNVVGLDWEIDNMYVAPSFLVPTSFSVKNTGWLSRGADSRWISLWFDEESDGETDATLTFVAYESSLDPSEIVTRIIRIDGVNQLTSAFERTIGGMTTVVVDVAGDRTEQAAGLSDCSQPASGMFTSVAGYPFFADGAGSFGIPACYSSRVWVMDVSDRTITAIGVTENSGQFERLMSILEAFLDQSVTFGDASASLSPGPGAADRGPVDPPPHT